MCWSKFFGKLLSGFVSGVCASGLSLVVVGDVEVLQVGVVGVVVALISGVANYAKHFVWED